MKKIILGSAVLAFAAMFFFQSPTQSQGTGYYKMKNCIKIGEKKCKNSGTDCGTARDCFKPPPSN